MARGDHIFVPLGRGLTHHGIDLGDGTVVHWCSGEDGKKKHLGDMLYRKARAQVRRTSMEHFCDGRPYRVRAYTSCFDPETVVQRALSRVGECDYDLLWNNCEHFATWCKVGESRSAQVEAVGGAVVAAGTKAALKAGMKSAAKSTSKVAVKSVARVATPAFLAADVVQAGAELAALNLGGTSAKTAESVGRVVGAGTSVAIGAAVAGPVGAVVGLGLWGLGEVVGSLFSRG